MNLYSGQWVFLIHSLFIDMQLPLLGKMASKCLLRHLIFQVNPSWPSVSWLYTTPPNQQTTLVYFLLSILIFSLGVSSQPPAKVTWAATKRQFQCDCYIFMRDFYIFKSDYLHAPAGWRQRSRASRPPSKWCSESDSIHLLRQSSPGSGRR